MISGPLVVGVTSLSKRIGTRVAFVRAVDLDGLAITGARAAEEVAIDVVLEALPDVITVTGSITASWSGACRRCLDDVNGLLDIKLSERFEREPRDEESYSYSGDHVDLEVMVREAVMLGLPLVPLCGEDCLGPAPAEYLAQTADESDAADQEVGPDPRWAALDQIKFT